MVSIYVASLFTSIPLDETVKIVLDTLIAEVDVVRVDNFVLTVSQLKQPLK